MQTNNENVEESSMMNQEKRKGLSKIISGVTLIIVGILGFIFGKNLKDRVLRTCILILSVLSISAGFYLFVDGTEDVAIGAVGQYKLESAYIQPMRYESPREFEKGLLSSINPGEGKKGTIHPRTRRLSYRCPDRSEEFIIYFTKLGVLGIPTHDVMCADGFKLLSYGD